MNKNTSWGFSPSPAGQQGGSGIIYLSSTGAADLNIEAVVIDGRDANDSPGDFNVKMTTRPALGSLISTTLPAMIPKTFHARRVLSALFRLRLRRGEWARVRRRL